MKSIIELTRAISDPTFCARQFAVPPVPGLTHILFLNPQLSGRHLYKMLLPYFSLIGNPNIKTAIQHISKFDPEAQLLGGKELELTTEMIRWSNIIIFPFTSQPLVSEIYAHIRRVNPQAKIIYQIDFNFYELSQKHPFYYIFSDETILSNVEDNAYFSDVIMVSNMELTGYLHHKFGSLVNNKYRNFKSNVRLACTPIFIDDKLMLENVEDYKPEPLVYIKADTVDFVQPTEHPQPLTDKIQEISDVNKNITDAHKSEQLAEQARIIQRRTNEKQSSIKKTKSATKNNKAKNNKPTSYKIIKGKKK